MEKRKLIPKRRFSEFSSEWEKVKLNEMGSTFTGLSGKTKQDFGHGTAEFLPYLNVFHNTIANVKDTEKVVQDDKQNQLQYGDILFTTSSETPEEVGMSSVWLDDRPNVYLNSFCFGYRPRTKIDHYFIGYYLRTNYFRNEIIKLAQGISRYNLSMKRVVDIPISITSVKEQAKIGRFFKLLDDRIINQKKKIEKVKSLKSAYLTEMFPQEGEFVPKRRFEGFQGPWEERKLVEIVDLAVDNRGKTPPLTKNGKHPLIEVVSLGSRTPNYEKVEKYINTVTYENFPRDYLQTNDILFSTVGRIGLVSLMDDNPYALIAQNIVGFRAKKDYCPNFLYALFSNKDSINRANRIVMGAVQPSVKVSQLIHVKYVVPKWYEEQQKIGLFFKNLDEQIETEEKKLVKLQSMKRAYLEELFV